ncbi:hypothetical protein Ddc_06597 [Ditylenchus destructor]|nr:hypothetical protein Ddc_06597 [Ditylenchus destructor]
MVRTRSGGLPENAHIVEEREKAAAEKRRISADKRKVAADKRADEKRRRVEVIIPKLRELFYDLDLTDFPKVSPGGSADELATYVVEHPRKFRKKPKEIPRVPTQDELETAVVDLVNAAETVYIPPDGKLLTAFMKDFHEFFSTESRLNNGKQFNADITSQLLHHNFPFCRTALILHLMDEFDGLYSAPAAAQNPQLVPGAPSLNQNNGQGANPAQPYNQAQNQQVTQNGQQNPGANNEQQPQNGQPLQPQFFFGLGMMMPPTNNQNNPQGGNGMPWGGIGNTMPNYPLPDNNEVTPDEMRRRMIGFMQAERMRQRHENRVLRNQQANPNNNLGMGQPQAQPQQEQPPYVRPGNFNFGNAQHDYDANDLFDDI